MKTFFAIIICLVCCFAAQAQQSLIGFVTNTTYAGLTTNTTIATGNYVGWNIDQIAAIQCTVVGTNANASNNVVLTFETSDNGTDWVPSVYPVVVDANGTTAATQISRITNSTGGKYVRPYSLANSNATAVTIQRFTVSIKEQ